MNLTRLSRSLILPHFTLISRQHLSSLRDPFPNKLTHYLSRAKLIDSIRLTLRSNHPITPLPTLLNTRLLDPFVVTHALRSSPNAESALFVFHSLESIPHFSHNQATLHALATVLAKSRKGSEFRTLIARIKKGCYPNVQVSFMNLMNWFAVIGDVEGVLSTWDVYRRSSDKHVCVESYNLVMGVYVGLGKDCEAVEVLWRMIDEGAIPNSRTYTVMMDHLVSRGKLDAAMEVFRALPSMRVKRTSRQYVLLVEGFVGVKRFEEVRSLVSEMRVDGKFPGRTMCVALQRLKEEGFVEETEELLRGMDPDGRIKSIGVDGESSDEDVDVDVDEDEDENVDIDNDDAVEDRDRVRLKPWLDPKALADALKKWSPEVVSLLEDAKFVWTTRLVCKVLRNFKSPETAWDFFVWVAYQPGFTHDVYTVQRMMTLLAQHGKANLVNQLITKVRSEGMRLPFSTIRLIIDYYGISKNADAALKVFRDDRALCGRISKFNMMLLYSSLLRTLTKCNRNPDAIDVLEEMILCGICPDIQTFSGLMYHFALQGDIKTVQKLFTVSRQSGIEPDAYVFIVLIQAYCKCERSTLAWRVFEDMRNMNLLPDASTKNLLVKSLWREGKRKEAALVEERCEEINETLPVALQGHLWTVSSADLNRVHNIYSSNLKTTNG